MDRVSFELQWISRKIEYLSNLSFPIIIHPQTMIKLKSMSISSGKMMTSRSPRMDPKGIAQELLGPISPLRQEMASVEDNVPRARTGQDGPGRARSWWEEGHTSPSSAHVHPKNSGKSSAQPSVKSPAKTKSLFRSHAHCKSLDRLLQSSTSPQDTYPIPDKP